MPFCVGADILNLLFFYNFSLFFHVYYLVRFDKATCLSLFFKFILSERLSNTLWGLDVLLFPKFINTLSFLPYSFIEFIILLYNFLVISFAWYKEYMVCLISCSKCPDILSAFTCARATGLIVLWINLYLASDTILI